MYYNRNRFQMSFELNCVAHNNDDDSAISIQSLCHWTLHDGRLYLNDRPIT